MSADKTKTTRRSFFLKGGAVVGAGVAGTSGAGALAHQGDAGSARLADREAIRSLHLTFIGRMEIEAYEAAAELFAEQAHLQLSGVTAEGRDAVREMLAEQYRHQKAPTLHRAYRPNGAQQQDQLQVSEDGTSATGTWHVDVRVATPLHGDSTVAQMARLQGNMANVRWEAGLLEATYVKTRGQWKLASLDYLAS